MKRVLCALVIIVIISCNEKREKTISNDVTVEKVKKSFYVGTYTNVLPVEEGGSEGIYQYSIDENGVLSKIGLAIKSENPSFLAKSRDEKYLIAVNEIDSNEGKGTVESYRIETDGLKKISSSSSGGAHPCHVSVNDMGQVVVSNYSSGNVGLLSISKNGTLSELLDVLQHSGKGNHERQEGPHAHSAWFRPDDNGVVSVDLGSNDLWFSQIINNKFDFQKDRKLNMNPEAGPRHLVFHPNGSLIYVLNELNNTISIIAIHNEGNYALGDSYSMLPDGFSDFSKGADIHMSKDGQFLYASNRGHNSIAIFKVNSDDGSLLLIGTESTKGESPRNFQLVLDDKFLVVGNQNSNNIVSFKRDAITGKLTFISKVEAPAPVCLLF